MIGILGTKYNFEGDFRYANHDCKRLLGLYSFGFMNCMALCKKGLGIFVLSVEMGFLQIEVGLIGAVKQISAEVKSLVWSFHELSKN